jgi:5'-nucleotidase
MLVLCSNDDGILAPGLACLERAARAFAEVYVVAPDREQSATSHSLTLHHPLRPMQLAEHRWQVDGTPTDCVMLAIEALMPRRPDFVLSGVNHGPNMGEDVLYSGTVAAAMEGLALGAHVGACGAVVEVARASHRAPGVSGEHTIQREPAGDPGG